MVITTRQKIGSVLSGALLGVAVVLAMNGLADWAPPFVWTGVIAFLLMGRLRQ